MVIYMLVKRKKPSEKGLFVICLGVRAGYRKMIRPKIKDVLKTYAIERLGKEEAFKLLSSIHLRVIEEKEDLYFELEQKEGVVKITLKREAEKIPTHLKASPNYIKAQTYYNTALRQKRIGSKEVNSYLRKAIKYAQYALQSKEGVEEEIRAFIRTCRKMLLMP